MSKKEKKEVIKNNILAQLKMQWKSAVVQQYKTEPDKVKNANITKNADKICSNLMVRMVMKTFGIKQDDIIKTLTDIREEVIQEAK